MNQLHSLLEKLNQANDAGQLLGIEGTASRLWFDLLKSQIPARWKFTGRVKRPPTDPINALLSFGYMVLFNRTEAAVQSAELDHNLDA